MPLDRRTAMKWVLAAGAAAQLPEFAFAAAQSAAAEPIGYGKDPDLLKTHAAGELWPLILNDGQKRTVHALCDIIVPAEDAVTPPSPASQGREEASPAASAVGVPEFIDEWISAPYPSCRRDRELIIPGLAWLDAEAQRRYMSDFAVLSIEQASRICDDICDSSRAGQQFAQAAAFFNCFRKLTAIGYYTTPVGMKDLRYTGNQPLAQFDGPPPEVLKSVGLA